MKYDGLLICSDFDGTLVDESKKVSAENAEAIRMFQSNGGRFTMATGRTPPFLSQMLGDITPNAPMITVNGSVLYDHALDKELLNIPLFPDNELVFSIYYSDGCIGCNLICRDYSAVELRNDRADRIEAYADILSDKLLKIVFIFDNTVTPKHYSEVCSAEYGDRFAFSRSWQYSLEMLDKDASKGKLTDRLRSILPDISAVIGVGDFENDISLIRNADIGYAVANADDEVKNAADRITVGCDENAIARIIYEL